jgi:spore coat protein U-like protein
MNKLIVAMAVIVAVMLVPLAAHAAPASFNVTATVLSKSICKFNTATSALAFGNLTPGSGVPGAGTALFNFVCNGSAANATFVITADDGLYSTGPGARRMRHATDVAQFIAYSINLNPVTATVPKGAVQVLTVTGSIAPAAYNPAIAGAYADTVIISITP